MSLYKSIPLIFNLLLFTLAFLIFFGLFPVKYLKGQYFKCVSLGEEEEGGHGGGHGSGIEIHTKFDCLDYGGDWINSDFHFDNILYSMFNLFVIATSEGWTIFILEAWDHAGFNL